MNRNYYGLSVSRNRYKVNRGIAQNTLIQCVFGSDQIPDDMMSGRQAAPNGSRRRTGGLDVVHQPRGYHHESGWWMLKETQRFKDPDHYDYYPW